MAEEKKIGSDGKKSGVIVIKRQPAAAESASAPERNPKETPEPTAKKVVVTIKKNPTVRVKEKVGEKPQKPSPEDIANTPGVRVVASSPKREPSEVAKKDAPAQKPRADRPRIVITPKPIPQTTSAPAANTNLVSGPRISSPIHNGPRIIHATSLPPVPGQKLPQGAAPVRPRVAGVVGGRPVRTPGQRNPYYQRPYGERNVQGNRTGFQNRDGQRPYGDRQGGFGGRPSFQRPYGDRGAQGARPGLSRPMGQRPSTGNEGGVDVNQKGAQRKTPDRRKGSNDYRARKDQELDFQYQQKKKEESRLAAVPKMIDIMENITVADLAKKMNLKANDIISKLFAMGMMVSINQSIDHDTAEIIAGEYGCGVHLVSLYDETIIEKEEDKPEDMVPRAPIVTIMGHVDHGKMKLLDAIRSTNVVAKEFGGITQHIGAYKVNVPDRGDVVFLDTPGHAAFSMMRARGAQVTDIIVLVVAANDGVMPQTREAIDHARAANVPIIVAINKCDLPDANPDRVMQQLSEVGLMPEEWGGQTLYCKISALKKQGIDDLLDTILLQAEMLDLRANPNCRAEGKILESRIDQGRGIVATVMIERGTLRQGDYYVAGIFPGRVRAMFDDKGNKIKSAGPATPVEIIGLSDIPSAGDPFQVTEDEKQARMVGAKRQELERLGSSSSANKVTLENLGEIIKQGQMKELDIIIKGDVQGSVEALQGTLEKLSTNEIRLRVIRASAGAIIESDVSLAAASNALIIGFNVRPTARAQALAEQEKVQIKKYNIIYDVVDDMKAAMEGMLSPEVKEIEVGKGEVRNTFRIPKVGIVAGIYVTEGKVTRNCFVRIIRDNIQINKENVQISSLKRFKDDAKEVTVGYECGVGLVDFQDLEIGDTLEFVQKQEIARKLEEVKV